MGELIMSGKCNPRLRRALAWVLGLLVLILVWLVYDNTVDRSGWVSKNGNYYYRDFHGKKCTGWQDIGTERYFFTEDKSMATYWQDIDGSRYYFGADGTLDTGWQEVEGKTYYFSPADGAMVTRWADIDGSRYYFDSDGSRRTGWLELDGKQYYLDEAGAMVCGWLKLEPDTYFFGTDGAMTVGWEVQGDNTYYFQSDGRMLTGRVQLYDEEYYFRDDGSMYTGWEDADDGRRYYAFDGTRAFGWEEIQGKRYFFGEEGLMRTGWYQDGEYRYYLQEDGSAAVGPVVIDRETHFFTPDGIHVVLVNERHRVPGYLNRELVIYEEWHQVDKICLEALRKMIQDCTEAGNEVIFNSAYRSIDTQAQILSTRTEEYMSLGYDYNLAYAKARETVALPGTSEHHLGLAVDLLGEGAIAWLTEHCWEYGFIVRYQADKAHITGIIDEPWHYRYVGTAVSLPMRDNGLCLEEYLGEYTQ